MILYPGNIYCDFWGQGGHQGEGHEQDRPRLYLENPLCTEWLVLGQLLSPNPELASETSFLRLCPEVPWPFREVGRWQEATEGSSLGLKSCSRRSLGRTLGEGSLVGYGVCPDSPDPSFLSPPRLQGHFKDGPSFPRPEQEAGRWWRPAGEKTVSPTWAESVREAFLSLAVGLKSKRRILGLLF